MVLLSSLLFLGPKMVAVQNYHGNPAHPGKPVLTFQTGDIIELLRGDPDSQWWEVSEAVLWKCSEVLMQRLLASCKVLTYFPRCTFIHWSLQAIIQINSLRHIFSLWQADITYAVLRNWSKESNFFGTVLTLIFIYRGG